MMIFTILNHIDSRRMALPGLQRGAMWKGEQVCGLFDPVQRCYDREGGAP